MLFTSIAASGFIVWNNATVQDARQDMATFLNSLGSNATFSSMFIDIGANLDVIRPPQSNQSVAVLAFEPVRYIDLKKSVKHETRLHVSPAAVSNEDGEAEMSVYHKYGVASSLGKPVDKQRLQHSRTTDISGQRVARIKVPVLSMQTVLSAVPARIEVWFLKTDMQGYDFKAIKGGGNFLQRVQYMKTECQINREQTYQGVDNDFCDHFWPFLTNQGFELIALMTDKLIPYVVGPKSAGEWCAKQSNLTVHPGGDHMAYDAYWVRSAGPRWPPPEPLVEPIEVAKKVRSKHLSWTW